MHIRRQKHSSSSFQSDLSNHSILFDPSTSSRPTPAHPSPSSCRKSLSPSPTSHKRNRFKTLFFAPSIRDSGISLGTPTFDPWFQSPLTPPSWPVPPVPVEDVFFQEELDFLVEELAARFRHHDSNEMSDRTSDRCDSPTLGSSSSFWTYPDPPMTSRAPSLWSMYGGRGDQKDSTARNSVLPGASLPNGPVGHVKPLKIHGPARVKSDTHRRPVLGLPQTFRRLAVTDPRIAGQPISFLSPDYVAGANSLKIGSCTFLNLAYGADVECGLRVEPQGQYGSEAKRQTVVLQVVQRVKKVRDGSTIWLMCSETDVTSAFTAEVRAELAARAQIPSSTSAKREPVSYHPGRAACEVEEPDIWLALAHTLSSNYAPTTTPLPASVTSPPSHTLNDLLSLLTELRFLHRQFFILHQEPCYDSEEPRLSIPYISASLYASLSTLVDTRVPDMDYDPRSNRNVSARPPADLDTQTQTVMFLFTQPAVAQARRWLSLTPGAIVLRETLMLPKLPDSRTAEEHIGVFGVWVGEDWGDNKRDAEEQGCWICFVVPPGVEMEL